MSYDCSDISVSMSRESAETKTSSGRGLRSTLTGILSSLSNLILSSNEQTEDKGGSGHLGRRRALRLSALLAPRNRLRFGAAAGVVIVAGVVAGSFLFNSPEELPLNNAIWLDRSWTYGNLDDSRFSEFTNRLIENSVGTAYAYVSSLGIDKRWSGGPQGKGSFMDSRPDVAQFVEAFKSKNERLQIFGWIEIWTHLDNVDGYRLDDPDLHQNIADFCRLLVEQLGFDGVLLDVKPLFSDNDDYIRLIRRVRAAVGVQTPIAVSITADLTPHDLRLQDIASIAPGTMWSPNFKKRVMVSADEVVLLMYQSYRQEPLDYINWVAYHVETYVNELETDTAVLVSIPNYGGASSAHNPAIETMEKALDGVSEGLRRLEEEQRPLLTGIAIYSDEQLSQSEWNVFREKWLQR